MRKHSAVRLADVAKASGVSMSTASKVLNARDDVAPETRRRVLAAISELGYVPSTDNRSTGGHSTVAVVFDALDTEFSHRLLQSIVTAAASRGVQIVVASLSTETGRAGQLTKSWVDANVTRGWAAMIVVTCSITAAAVDACQALNLPLVGIDSVGPAQSVMPTVGSANWSGACEATAHLIQLGHRRIAFVNIVDLPMLRERLAGYRHTMDQAGLAVQVSPTLIRAAEFEGVVTDLLSGDDRPTAVFVPVDLAALEVMSVARRVGLRVPEDLSVVGFDDLTGAAQAAPGLTTVRQSVRDLGSTALAVALDLASRQPVAAHTQLPTKLVVRGSTASPM